jgi:hypothetical protein
MILSDNGQDRSITNKGRVIGFKDNLKFSLSPSPEFWAQHARETAVSEESPRQKNRGVWPWDTKRKMH